MLPASLRTLCCQHSAARLSSELPQHPRRRALVACRAQTSGVVVTRSAEAFEDLALKVGVHLGNAALRPGEHMRGVFATETLQKGDAVMTVPLEVCIDLDYSRGLSIRDAEWPLLHAAVRSGASDALPWEVLFGLALVDARRGHGDALWREYAAHLLPPVGGVPLPCLQGEDALRALQHPAFEAAALEQARELRGMWERVTAAGVGADRPLMLEELLWGFACARSRAFALSADRFAQVPFMDCLNHAQPANCKLTLDDAAEAFVVRTDKALAAETELSLSYTGQGEKTNRQLLASSGFVLPESASDRLDLGLQDGFVGTAPQRGQRGAGLSLAKLQDFLGDAAFLRSMMGESTAATCAMKSLPTYDSQVAPEDINSVAAQEREFVGELRRRLDAVEAEFETNISEDEELLQAQSRGTWSHVAVQYRLERKKLAGAARSVLEWYEKQL